MGNARDWIRTVQVSRSVISGHARAYRVLLGRGMPKAMSRQHAASDYSASNNLYLLFPLVFISLPSPLSHSLHPFAVFLPFRLCILAVDQFDCNCTSGCASFPTDQREAAANRLFAATVRSCQLLRERDLCSTFSRP